MSLHAWLSRGVLISSSRAVVLHEHALGGLEPMLEISFELIHELAGILGRTLMTFVPHPEPLVSEDDGSEIGLQPTRKALQQLFELVLGTAGRVGGLPENESLR